MSIYLNTQTQEYPRFIGDLQLLGWVVGEPLPENWVEVTSINPPTITNNQIATEEFPVNIDGTWSMSWVVRELTEEEKTNIAAANQAELDKFTALTK
jgi:hypothetical protein